MKLRRFIGRPKIGLRQFYDAPSWRRPQTERRSAGGGVTASTGTAVRWRGLAAGEETKMDLTPRFNDDPLPFAALLGVEIVSATPEKIIGAMTVREALCTRPAVLHGGAIMAFADTLGALATLANLKDGAGTTTIESKTNFIGAAPLGARILGETTPVHRGRRTMVWQTRVTTQEGKLVAVVTQTQLVL
jgi:uncharacterized protein (TIGR00369 family)